MENNKQQSDQEIYGINYCKSNTPVTFINSLLEFLVEMDLSLAKMHRLLYAEHSLEESVLIRHFSVLEPDLFDSKKKLLMLVSQLKKVIIENEDILAIDDTTYITSTNSKLNFFMRDYVKIYKFIDVMYTFDTNMNLDLDNVRDSIEMIRDIIESLKNLKHGILKDSDAINKKFISLQNEINSNFQKLYSNKISKILKDMKEV